MKAINLVEDAVKPYIAHLCVYRPEIAGPLEIIYCSALEIRDFLEYEAEAG